MQNCTGEDASFYGKSMKGTVRDSKMKRLCICVDDFGLHEGINLAALELGEMGRVSAISCMTDGPAWKAGASQLRQSGRLLEVGLHVSLTEDLARDVYHSSLPRLIASSYLHLLDRKTIRESIYRQLSRFCETLGSSPAFIDGHQHVHQLPVVRNILIEVLDKFDWPVKPWIRKAKAVNSTTGLTPWLKSRLISLLGSSAMQHLADKHGYLQNNRLLGVYDFGASETAYLDHLDAWLSCARDGDLLMCHPSTKGAWNDEIIVARVNEYHALRNKSFAELVERHSIAVLPMTDHRFPDYS